MDELDLLKKDWKRNENSFNQVTDKEIYAMIHKKSSSIVKWILIISVLEAILWTVLGTLPVADDYLEKSHPEYALPFECFTYFNYAVILVFIYLFYRNYVRISTTASTRQLMDDIIRTRKTVNYYVWYNLAMIMLSFVFGLVLAFLTKPEIDQLRQKANEDGATLAVLIFLMILFVAIVGCLSWLFYRLVYGIFLRKLLSNYKELKKIDL
ncbi:hypothetical protein [Flavobacterium selenitireducens]|uniref:hypothetical protein n=1 Tax=Flavobacterium selenitireducens TaxID=2722704 RepID=UPI00168C0E65|nr:hypothetical protein [Flavobacterium selenitireducens]MBD3583955.1 hypothetical protein [Flavobacterium selenitireducens]